ncbi:MAG: nucleotidyltransferase domain-containing protein [bacterium]
MLQKKSLGSVKFISIHREALLEALQKTAESVRIKYPEVLDIRLFGSIAKKEQVGTSDVDILIILNKTTDAPYKRILRFRREFDIAVPLDLLVYTKDEITRMISEKNSFIDTILKEGISLIGR